MDDVITQDGMTLYTILMEHCEFNGDVMILWVTAHEIWATSEDDCYFLSELLDGYYLGCMKDLRAANTRVTLEGWCVL